MTKRSCRKNIVRLALSAIGLAFGAFPALGAERIQFFYGPFEPTIYVDDLEAFAATGEISDRLSFVKNRLNSEQKESLQNMLNARYSLDTVSVSQFTYSPIGEKLLRNAGQIVQTENFLNGMKPLRASLIFAEQQAEIEGEEGFSLMQVIRLFPLETIQLDAALMRQLVAENERIYRRRDSITQDIQRISDSQAAQSQVLLPDSNPRDPGIYSWQVETFQFQNPARSQPSVADLYYPSISNVSDNSIPVVVISHGFASSRRTFAYIARHLASHGYAVIALEHIETDRGNISLFLDGLEGAPDPNHLLQRPQDITAVLDHLEASQGELFGASSLNPSALNLDAVGLMGQSLGGYTVLAAAGARINRPKLLDYCSDDMTERLSLNLSMLIQCRLLEIPAETSLEVADDRVAAAIALNPLTSQIFGESGISQIQVPVMLVASTHDYFVPALPEQVEPFSWLTSSDKKLVLIEPGTHFSALEASEQSAFPVPRGLVGSDPRQAFPQIQALGLSFFDLHLRRADESKVFLTQGYLNSFPESDFRFSLVDEYPVQPLVSSE